MYHTHTRSECCITRSRTLVDVPGLGAFIKLLLLMLQTSSSYGSGIFTIREALKLPLRKLKKNSAIHYGHSKHAESLLTVIKLPICRAILMQLGDHSEGLTVTQLVDLIKIDSSRRIKQSIVSQHLTKLRKYGVVMFTRNGNTHTYVLCVDRIARISSALDHFFNPLS